MTRSEKKNCAIFDFSCLLGWSWSIVGHARKTIVQSTHWIWMSNSGWKTTISGMCCRCQSKVCFCFNL